MPPLGEDAASAAGQILAGPGDPLVAGVVAAKQAKAARDARDLASSKFLLSYVDKHPDLLAHPSIGAAYDKVIGVPGVHEQVLLKYAQDRNAAYENDPQAGALAQALTARSGVRSEGLTAADRSFTAAPVDESGAPTSPTPAGPSRTVSTEQLAQQIPVPTGGGGGGGGTTSSPTLRPEATASFKIGDQTISVTGKGQREAQFHRLYSQLSDAYEKGGLDQGEAQTVAAQDAARQTGVIPEGFGDLVLAPAKMALAGKKETIVQQIRTNFAQAQGYQRELGGRKAALALPKNTEEDIASSVSRSGLTGQAAIDTKQNIRESYAAGMAGARVAGQRGAATLLPRTPEERAAASANVAKEALDRGLTPGQPDYNAYVADQTAGNRQAVDSLTTEATGMAKAKAEAGAQVREEFRMPSPGTQKTLGDVGIVKTIVGRMNQLLADPVLGPEIANSRGVFTGRVLHAARVAGFDIDAAANQIEKATGQRPKTLWDIVDAQAQIVAIQPYLRGVRRYEFIQDARSHIPAPGDTLPVIKVKLQELNTLADNYRDIALFYDRPASMIRADVAAGKVPVPLAGIISGGANPTPGVPVPPPAVAAVPSAATPPAASLGDLAAKLAGEVTAGRLTREQAVEQYRAASPPAPAP